GEVVTGSQVTDERTGVGRRAAEAWTPRPPRVARTGFGPASAPLKGAIPDPRTTRPPPGLARRRRGLRPGGARTGRGCRAGARRGPGRPHCRTRHRASSTMDLEILDVPARRSTKVIGTSSTTKPARQVRRRVSSWKL